MAGRQQGADEALDVADLVIRYSRPLYAYAYRLCGSAADAEDLVQQTFLVAHQKGLQVRKLDRVQSWLFTVLRNCFLKGQRRRQPLLAENIEFDLASIPVSKPADDEIDREQLQAALDALSDEHRVVLLMFYFEQASYREIADELEIPMGTVMSRLSRAKQHLRRQLFQTADPDSAVRRHDDIRLTTG